MPKRKKTTTERAVVDYQEVRHVHELGPVTRRWIAQAFWSVIAVITGFLGQGSVAPTIVLETAPSSDGEPDQGFEARRLAPRERAIGLALSCPYGSAKAHRFQMPSRSEAKIAASLFRPNGINIDGAPALFFAGLPSGLRNRIRPLKTKMGLL